MKLFYTLLLFLFFSPSIFAQSQTPTKIIEVPSKPVPVTSIINIKIALKDLGYDVDTINSKNILDTRTNKALRQFQRDYEAPVCCMSFCILNFLFETHQEFLNKEE